MSNSPLRRSGMARVKKGSHVESGIPAFTLQPQSITALWLVLISRLAQGRRLSWVGLNWAGLGRGSEVGDCKKLKPVCLPIRA